MTLVDQRLAQIRHAYFTDAQGAADALQVFRKATQRKAPRRKLSRLLRHHDDSPINDSETWIRDGFDSLLAYFSMVEIGCLSGFLPNELPSSYQALARRVLLHPDVRAYYRDNYPLYLPQLHLLRLEGHALSRERDTMFLFDSFFELSLPFETSSAVETFLWFLDGGARDGFDFEDTIDALRSPNEFLKHSSARAEDSSDGEMEVLSASVQGFLHFVEFAPRLLTLLRECSGLPLLQSALWHFHGYWFGQMGTRIGADVRNALEAIGSWESTLSSAVKRESAERLHAGRLARREQETALEYLSSGRFSYPVIEKVLVANAALSLRILQEELAIEQDTPSITLGSIHELAVGPTKGALISLIKAPVKGRSESEK